MREDTYTEPTIRFADLHTAIQCMQDDCGFDISKDPQGPLNESPLSLAAAKGLIGKAIIIA